MTPNPPPLVQQQPRSRYPGTHPFGDSPEDQVRFFGRTEEAEELHLRVLSVPLLVQFGRSGLGKTSLLQAGLFPRLRRKPFLPTMVRLNDTNDSFTGAVTRSLQEACDAEGIEFVPGDTSTLWRLLSTTTIWRGDLLLTPVLVFDQFEEVFTLRDAEFRRSVATEIGAIAGARWGSAPPAKMVISLREDYLGALEEFSAAIPDLFQERLRLKAMSREAARAAITGPARLTAGPQEQLYASRPFEFNRSALEAMVAYLQGTSGVIEPFQLQLLCGHAEEIAARKQGEPVTLTIDDFRGEQGFASVLHNFYRGTLDKLTPRSQRKRAAMLCEEGLLDTEGHRLMLHEGQILTDYGVKPPTLATLCQTRLIRSEQRQESTFYEISHDRLAESIVAERQNRLPKNIRRGLWSTGAAAVIVVALLLAWNQSVERQRRAAQNARDSAESLLSFLLGEEFLGEIRDTGRSSMLDAVRKKVEESGTGGMTPLNQALAMRHEGDMKLIESDLPHALEFQRQSLAIFETLGNEREIARAQSRVGVVLAKQGRTAEASNHYAISITSWERVTGAAGAGADDCIEMADSLREEARLYDKAGRVDRATENLQRAVRIASNVLFGGKGSCAANWESVIPFPHAEAIAVLVGVASHRYYSMTPQDAAGTAAMADHARKLKPQSVKARRAALLALLARGIASPPPQALKDLREALAGFDELGRWDPRNLSWVTDRAAVQLSLAAVIERCQPEPPHGSPCSPMPPIEDAVSMTLEALTTLRALAAADRSDVVRQDNVVTALQRNSFVTAVAGHPAEALSRLQEAERFGNERHGRSLDERTILGPVIENETWVLAYLLGRPADAAKTLQRAIDLYEPVQRRFPNNVEYIDLLTNARRQEREIRTMLGDRPGAAAAAKEVARLVKTREEITRPIAEKKALLQASDAQHFRKAADLIQAKNYAGALPELVASEASAREQILFSPTRFASYSTLGATYKMIAEVQMRLNDREGEFRALAAAMNAAQVAAWLAPDDQLENRNLALLDARNDIARLLFERGRRNEALQVVRENVTLAEEMAQKPDCMECQWHLGVAKCLFASGQRNVSVDGLRGGIIHIERAAKNSKNGFIFKDLGDWQLKLAAELEKSGSPSEVDEQRRLALAAYRRAHERMPDDAAVNAVIAATEKLVGPSSPR